MSDAPRRRMQEDPHLRSRLVGVNVPRGERIATGLVGAAAILMGARQRSLAGAAAIGLGTVAIARAITGRCPIYRARAIRKGIQVRRVITIQASPQEIYEVWRDLANLPRFMSHVKTVIDEGGGVSRWCVEIAGKELVWRAETIEDTPNRRLRWKSLPGGDISHEGEIDIREETRGTVVEVKMRYFPPGGLLVASALYGVLRKIAKVDIGTELVRLRQLLETGEIATGKRRVADLPEDDKAVTAPSVAPDAARSSFASAQTRDLGDFSGGVR